MAAEDWEELAKQMKYPGEKEMWEDLYSRREMSIAELSRRFDSGTASIHKRLTANGIPTRPRGGKNNQRVVVTAELVERCRNEGVTPVATELGLSYNTLHKALLQFKRGEGTPSQPSPEVEPHTPDGQGE